MKEKIVDVMKERDYDLSATSGEDTFHFHTPLGENPMLVCDVLIRSEESIEFRFRYVTKKCFELCSGWISPFFDNEQFNKFENWFWDLATVLYDYEKR